MPSKQLILVIDTKPNNSIIGHTLYTASVVTVRPWDRLYLKIRSFINKLFNKHVNNLSKQTEFVSMGVTVTPEQMQLLKNTSIETTGPQPMELCLVARPTVQPSTMCYTAASFRVSDDSSDIDDYEDAFRDDNSISDTVDKTDIRPED